MRQAGINALSYSCDRCPYPFLCKVALWSSYTGCEVTPVILHGAVSPVRSWRVPCPLPRRIGARRFALPSSHSPVYGGLERQA